MSANGVLLLTILLAKIAILGIKHHAHSHSLVPVRGTVWGFKQIIIWPQLILIYEAIVDMLGYRLRNWALNHILFRSFC